MIKPNFDGLPNGPGVYFFKDRHKKTIYIGKALSIRKRVRGHYRFFGEPFSKEGKLLRETSAIDFIETPNEAEALLLEASLVKEFLPKYNQELKDDKSYPFLKITAEEFPRLLITRARKPDGGKIFGPYTNVRLLRQAVRMLRREFPMRTCKQLPKKVCLMYHIGQCHAPCVGYIGKPAYDRIVKDLENFLLGRRDAVVKSLLRRMKQHAEKREYEKAKTLYEEIRALESVPNPVLRDWPGVLRQLKEALGLSVIPERIECFDISNIFGEEAVGSMVVFVSGEPARSGYRRFRIRTVTGIDDYRMMREVVRRRYARLLNEKKTLPDLVVIDGGKGHLSAAKNVLDELGLKNLPVISIAKQHEHLFKPGREAPFIFPQSSPILQLVQRLRDEAHRFAIRYHRHLRKKEGLFK
ncbi:MAG: excinuclease ABC subunit UvrC [Candidatus Omnitrophica bacterium]|nr:excinuclease ABC subunit UvrC [Candidatus Omnitrophota bacterium]